MTPLVDEVDDDQDADPNGIEPFVRFFDKLFGVEQRLFTIGHTPILPHLESMLDPEIDAPQGKASAGYPHANAASVTARPKDVVEHLLTLGLEIGNSEDTGETLYALRWSFRHRNLLPIAAATKDSERQDIEEAAEQKTQRSEEDVKSGPDRVENRANHLLEQIHLSTLLDFWQSPNFVLSA